MIDLQRLLEVTCEIALEAGVLIQKIQAEGVEASSKEDLSPVTRADHEADALLKRKLLAVEPVA
jgi:3'(2'), 5'-bisphosphate nucleotidase